MNIIEAYDKVSNNQSVGRDFQISIVSFPHGAGKWQLVSDFLSLRKRVFVDSLRWSLVHENDLEFEQYDNFSRTTYVLAHRDSTVIGGARLLRTDTTMSGIGKVRYSYMIRDACLGHLPNMPTELCDQEAPVSSDVWELTRLVTESTDPTVGQAILSATNEFLWELSASDCLFLGPPGFMKMAKRMGFSPSPMGKIQGNEDGRFLAFSCSVLDPSRVIESTRRARPSADARNSRGESVRCYSAANNVGTSDTSISRAACQAS